MNDQELTGMMHNAASDMQSAAIAFDNDRPSQAAAYCEEARQSIATIQAELKERAECQTKK